eukprot:1569629-Prymnesium_polylepis.1
MAGCGTSAKSAAAVGRNMRARGAAQLLQTVRGARVVGGVTVRVFGRFYGFMDALSVVTEL